MPKPQFCLVEVNVSNYRNCRHTTFKPNRGLSALIGVNGSGKTTILNAISLLKNIFSRRVQSRRLFEPAAERAKVCATFLKGKRKVYYKAEVSFATNERNVDEIIASIESWNFDDFSKVKIGWMELPSSLLLSLSQDWDFAGRAPTEYLMSYAHRHNTRSLRHVSRVEGLQSMKVILDLGTPHLFKVTRLVSEIADLLAHTTYYSASQFTNPLRAPSSFELEEDRPLLRDMHGSSHITFLHELYRSYKRNDANYRQFLNVVGDQTLGLVKNIKFKPSKFPTTQYEVKSGGKLIKRQSNREIIIPFFTIGDLRLSPNQLSEGVLKTIALVFYLITDESRILLIEEPEVCIHHGLLRSIVELMKSISAQKQVIFSTHSDLIIDLLAPSDVFLVRYIAKSGIKAVNLPASLTIADKIALKEYLSNTGSLGEYIKQGGLSDE